MKPIRRSFVLVATLVIVGCALLVATQMLFLAQADAAGSAGVGDAAQSRALLWSGTQAVMAKLNEQRETILRGELPRIDAQYEIYETPGGSLGVVRLLPMTGGGQRFQCEAGKLDLNSIDAETLARTGMIEAPAANAIIAYRNQLGRPLQSIGELLLVPDAAITPEKLYGPINEIACMDQAQQASLSLDERILARLGGATTQGLADILTVYSFEPALQRNGKLRINLNVPWSDELGKKIEERFGLQAVNQTKSMFDRGVKFDSEARIFQVLRGADVAIEVWPEIVDAVTTEAGEYHFGRLDINTAPLEAIAALPGLTHALASQIVSVRDELSPQDRSTAVWPIAQDIVDAKAYDALAGKITTRCWIYRVRLAAGEVPGDDPSGLMHRPAIWEVVIDLTAPKPRIAYLRDITQLQNAAALAMSSAVVASESAASEIESGAPDNESTLSKPVESEVVSNQGRELHLPAKTVESETTSAQPADPWSSKQRSRLGRWTSGE